MRGPDARGGRLLLSARRADIPGNHLSEVMEVGHHEYFIQKSVSGPSLGHGAMSAVPVAVGRSAELQFDVPTPQSIASTPFDLKMVRMRLE